MPLVNPLLPEVGAYRTQPCCSGSSHPKSRVSTASQGQKLDRRSLFDAEKILDVAILPRPHGPSQPRAMLSVVQNYYHAQKVVHLDERLDNSSGRRSERRWV
eukprot:IDg8068t1